MNGITYRNKGIPFTKITTSGYIDSFKPK